MSPCLRRYGVLVLAGVVAAVAVRLISAGGGAELPSADRNDRLSVTEEADLWVTAWNPEGPEGPIAVAVEWYGAAEVIGFGDFAVAAGYNAGTCCPEAVAHTDCTNPLPVVRGEPSSPLSCDYLELDHQSAHTVYANLRTGLISQTRYACWRNDRYSTAAASVFACELSDLP